MDKIQPLTVEELTERGWEFNVTEDVDKMYLLATENGRFVITENDEKQIFFNMR